MSGYFATRETADAPGNVDVSLIPEGYILIGVVVTNIHRGIYFGFFLTTFDKFGRPALPRGAELELLDSRHCRYYGNLEGAEHLGYWSLATKGPKEDSQVGPAVAQAVIRNVQNVLICTREALETFHAQGWGQCIR